MLVPAQSEHPLGALTDGGQAQLGQPGRLDYRPGLTSEVRQRLRAPQGQRLVVGGDRVLCVTTATGALDQAGEPVYVHIARVGAEPVAGSVAVHQLRCAQAAERPAQLRHPQLQCVGWVVREVTGIPECVDERRDRYGLAGGQREQGEQGAFAAAGERLRRGVDADLERPEQPEFHRINSRRGRQMPHLPSSQCGQALAREAAATPAQPACPRCGVPRAAAPGASAARWSGA